VSLAICVQHFYKKAGLKGLKMDLSNCRIINNCLSYGPIENTSKFLAANKARTNCTSRAALDKKLASTSLNRRSGAGWAPSGDSLILPTALRTRANFLPAPANALRVPPC